MAALFDSESPEIYEQKLDNLDRIGVGLVREGFRQLLEENNFKIDALLLKSKVIHRIVYLSGIENAKEREWATRSLKFVAMGISSPLIFLREILEKFKLVHGQNLGSRSFRILRKT